MPQSLVTIDTLRNHCVENFNLLNYLLPKLVFEDVEQEIHPSSDLPCNVNSLKKRLQVGTYKEYSKEDTTNESQPLSTSYDAYLCVAIVEGKNRVELTFGPKNSAIRTTSKNNLRFDELFSSLDIDMTSHEALEKLQAIGCAFFLAAGHISSFIEYPDLFMWLGNACAWIRNNGNPPCHDASTPSGAARKAPASSNPSKSKHHSHSTFEEDNPQDDDEMVKSETQADPPAEFQGFRYPDPPVWSSMAFRYNSDGSSGSQMPSSRMKQTKLTSLGIDYVGRSSSQEPRQMSRGLPVRSSSGTQMTLPYQHEHGDMVKELADPRQEKAVFQEHLRELIQSNNDLKARAQHAESQNDELQLLKIEVENLRQQLDAATEGRKIEAEGRQKANSNLEACIQGLTDLAGIYQKKV